MIQIPVIYSFARSGGTLVNQLFGVHPDCLVLSEVNPAASVVPLVRQALEWLNLIEITEVDQFHELSYPKQISLLSERAKSKGKTLIIRDWVVVNYLPWSGGSLIAPSSTLEMQLYLAHIGYDTKPLVVTRRAQSIYTSIKFCFPHLANLSIDVFASSYLTYARAVSTFPKISLEFLQSNPRETLFKALQILELSTEYIDFQINTFSEFQMCTGNNTLAVPSETSKEQKIISIRNASLAEKYNVHNEKLIEADLLMGYEV